jgi:ribonucleoside-triphosphate reductase
VYVNHRFELDHRTSDHLHSLVPPFGYDGFGELLYYRTYSRVRNDGGQEDWGDTVVRTVNGVFSIRKDFYIKLRIPWDEAKWQNYAKQFGEYLFMMKWLPPGRGLWMMGSEFMYERGSMALYNCAYTNLGSNDTFADDLAWLMDSLMNGVGVGFGPQRDTLKLVQPASGKFDFYIPDTREGWVDATWKILKAYTSGCQVPYLIYDYIRRAGAMIKGFGGVCSGPEPLIKMHKLLIEQCELCLAGKIDIVEFKTNCANLIGCCVVAGNVRRSAEISCGSVRDEIFMNLKDYERYPHRAAYGWMSNNSVIMESADDFDMLGEVAKRLVLNGEPGVINRKNLKFGRIGKKDNCRPDQAIGFNPCGEIPLEHREVCNLAETFPTMCRTTEEWYQACEYASFYCSTVSLLPTHQPSTNRVVARNRRIGVGLVDFTGWCHRDGVHKVTKALRRGYERVSDTNRWANAEAGIPEAIRKTTVKPGGTTPKLPGKTSGAGYPTFRHTIRRVRVQQDTSFHALLVKAQIPYEKDSYSDNTDSFEYPIIQGPAKPAEDVSIWQQAANVILLQREWSDNAVSNTIYFRPKWVLTDHLLGEAGYEEAARIIGLATLKRMIERKQREFEIANSWKVIIEFVDGKPSSYKIYEFDPRHEEDDVEAVLSSTVPLCKSLTVLPHTAKGVYKQMPEEGITDDEYHRRVAQLLPIDWSELSGSDGQDERYCQGETCEITLK